MLKAIQKGYNLIRDFFQFFQKGWQAHLTIPYIKSFISLLLVHINQFRHSLYTGGIELHTISDERIKKLRTTAKGLHSLLPPIERLTYSILMLVDEPDEFFLRTALESLFHQSPSFELLIGLKGSTERIRKVLSDLKIEYPLCVHVFTIVNHETALFELAEKAKGNFLFLMGQEDWIRPDLLFRYEQTLRMCKEPENTVLSCDINQLSAKNSFLPGSAWEFSAPSFPYFFKKLRAKGLLVPKQLWDKISKEPFCKGAEEEDLCLRLDLAGAKFQHVPFCLYSMRKVSKKDAIGSSESYLCVLKNYTAAKGLNWEWNPGYHDSSFRAIPSLPKICGIQVIVPFKDQKELTLKCIKSVLKQENVPFKITAVDNRSADLSIAKEIEALGAEVLSIDEPFNYSRLNNLAVHHTKTAADCDILLFLNNDVELEADALKEMLRWINQPDIGMVGCRLNFPNGKLQHGGVRLDSAHKTMMRWEHIEKLRSFEELEEAKNLGIVDAVTAACAMIKKKIFLEIGGFDEIWYPIGYSDTNLAIKLAAKNLRCFYTPYAVGIHYESITRKASIEDFENSWWLHRLWTERQHKNTERA